MKFAPDGTQTTEPVTPPTAETGTGSRDNDFGFTPETPSKATAPLPSGLRYPPPHRVLAYLPGYATEVLILL